MDRANSVPQTDKMGKEAVWQKVRVLRTHGLLDVELNVTDGTRLMWWLWICNLAGQTHRVIGSGVHSAHVSMRNEHEARFRFGRMDGTESVVLLIEEEFPHRRLIVSVP